MTTENLVKKYSLDSMKIIYNKKGDYTEYFLTNVHWDIVHKSPFNIGYRYNDDTSKTEVVFCDKNTGADIYNVQFSHQENIQYFTHVEAKCKGNSKYEFLIGISGIPHWEKMYIYGNERIPNHCKQFYEIFKYQFLNGNFIDLKGETNFSFFLMFDLLKTKQNNLKTHLLNLIKNYPEVTRYCEDEMGKIGMPFREYKGSEYISFQGNIYVVKKDFPNKQSILNWLCGGFFKSKGLAIYVNANGIIDAVEDKTLRLYANEKRGCCVFPFGGNLPEFIKFGEVDGNFTIINSVWSSDKNKNSGYNGGIIECHKVISLKGSPDVVRGNFVCEELALTSLIGGPRVVYGNYNCKNNSITSFVGVPEKIEGCFNFTNNELTDDAWEYAKENIDGEFADYKHSGNKFVKYRSKLY